MHFVLIRPNKKKYLCLGLLDPGLTLPYLNLLVKPRICIFRFSGKNITLCILKGEMPFKMHKIIFPEKKSVPTLPKISDLLPETHLFFIWL